ncbi:MAG: type II toxin-antitoxin system PemK/MazF family toxin [Chlorobiaceae bacterium]|nr:type II toxin-antitoxin system PemK/MazF family toxin [Chlorobiaceae bacterium]
MKRGDLVTIALQDYYGKPRPAVVVQADFFSEHPSLTILPVTSELRTAPLFRIMVEPTEENNLKKRSQVMVDKVQTVPREKIGPSFGRLDDASMLAVNRALTVWLGFA